MRNTFSSFVIEFLLLLMFVFMVLTDWDLSRFYDFIKSPLHADKLFGLVISCILILISYITGNKIGYLFNYYTSHKILYSINFIIKLLILFLLCRAYYYFTWVIMST